MNVYTSPAGLGYNRDSVVTVGTFDGVHRAHRQIIAEVTSRARALNGRSVVITFDPHPKLVVPSTHGPVRLLTTTPEKLGILQGLAVDSVLLINFTWDFSRITSREFYRTYVVEAVGVREVVVGYDHMFGRDREAGVDELKEMSRELGFAVTTVDQFRVHGQVVSSTQIRRALATGDVARAAEYLGTEYTLTGRVVHGDGRGSNIGFPTANIAPASPEKVIPAHGVYVVRVRAGGTDYHGMMNIGVRPTLTDGTTTSLEAHLFGFSGTLYGTEISVSFLARVRDEQKFPSVGELIRQLERDRETALRIIDERVRIPS